MNHKDFAPFALRIGIGGLFIFAGLMKLMNPSGVVQMLTKIGFPAPLAFAWLLIIVELLFGAAVLTGFQLKYTTVPLAIVLVVAVAVNIAAQPMGALKDVALLAMLVSLWLSGPGIWGLSKK